MTNGRKFNDWSALRSEKPLPAGDERALPANRRRGKVQEMTRERFARLLAGGALLAFLTSAPLVAEGPTVAAVSGFNDYVGRLEGRLAKQHRSAEGFVAPVDEARLRSGEVVIEHLTPATGQELPRALFITGGVPRFFRE